MEARVWTLMFALCLLADFTEGRTRQYKFDLMIGRGIRNYDPKASPSKFNLVDPVERNIIGVPSDRWIAIRFSRANNPSIWFLHCHLEMHTTWGLKMTFLVDNGESPNETILPTPKDLLAC
ncbi:hypothetical protein OPV22_017245 [Ensete ventricosum]|uniref:Plastocyanin-like domain-containing protein n=1 Tax=Ensete ventricosum TaxID=4639 RepID=A0AAV8QTD7_ENSVE|nr:hypothetical protein OPV22_017245 [Ensete ventricosum]